MPDNTRIYRIDDGDDAHLVRAHNAAQAVRHVASRFKSRVATQHDLCELLERGTKVQQVANGDDQDDDEDDE
jgi:hypothetical protein